MLVRPLEVRRYGKLSQHQLPADYADQEEIFMGRIRHLQLICLTLTAFWVWLAPAPVSAQSSTATPQASTTPTNTVAPAATAESEAESEATSSPTTTVTPTQAPSPLLPTPTPAQANTSTVVAADAPLEGTIIANRSQSDARYFVEGVTYVLAAGRSQGLELPRPSTVLNLFNCDADTPETQAGCFWDPYLIQQDGFFEIYDSPDTVASSSASGVKLLLRQAGTPPADQVWVQNRTAQLETLVYRGEVFEIEPTAILEFPVETGVVAILYVRHCLTLDGQSVCEWSPKSLEAGIYYAMEEIDTPGIDPGSVVTSIDLQPVVGEVGLVAVATTTAPSTAESAATPAPTSATPGATDEIAEEATDGTTAAATPTAATESNVATSPVASGPQVICSLEVPALNIRSGPGLQYDITGKVRTTGAEAATVAVVARSADEQWLVVDPAVAEDGWITSSASFITCDGDTRVLPLAETPPLPTPVPSIVEEPATGTGDDLAAGAPITAPAAGEIVTDTNTAETPGAPAIPPGQAVLVVNNGFQYEIRFTIDQTFRPNEGPSEYDLQPGSSVSIVVYPGQVAFTASSPWSSLSGNAELTIEPDTALPLWLRFEQDGNAWVLRWN